MKTYIPINTTCPYCESKNTHLYKIKTTKIHKAKRVHYVQKPKLVNCDNKDTGCCRDYVIYPQIEATANVGSVNPVSTQAKEKSYLERRRIKESVDKPLRITPRQWYYRNYQSDK